MKSRITSREIVIAENSRLQVRIYELQYRINALNADKDELIRKNTQLRNRNEEITNKKNQLETDNIQICAANKNLTQLNTALRTVLRDAEDKKDHYKAANIKEFDDFISNFVFGLFNNFTWITNNQNMN
ncbi:31142_t:CDS:1, partial [Racocetra persica]